MVRGLLLVVALAGCERASESVTPPAPPSPPRDSGLRPRPPDAAVLDAMQDAQVFDAAVADARLLIHYPDASDNFLGNDEVDRIVKMHGREFRACYQRRLNAVPGLGGVIELTFRITARGSVDRVAAKADSTLHDLELQGCLEQVIRALQFPASGGVTNVATYPLVFSPGG